MKRWMTQIKKLARKTLIIIMLFLLVACASAQASVPDTAKSPPPPGQTDSGITSAEETVKTNPDQPDMTDTPPIVKVTSENGSENLDVAPGASNLEFSTQAPEHTPTPRPTLQPDAWMTLPVIPTPSETARQIFQRGLEMGNDPHAFAKVGDCQNITTYFLAYFDRPGYYSLGDYTSLQETIDWFAGSFKRESMSVKGGFNAAAILSPLRANPDYCREDESPLACEYRLHNPSIAIISLEEWWAGNPEKYEIYMRQIIEFSIDEGVVPIVATKADNLEGDHTINQTIARLSWEYDIPLWNFWLAVQPLPNHGLVETTPSGEVDMFHLTHSEGHYFYDNPRGPQSGWSMRNLTALQALDSVWRGLTDHPQP